MQIFLKLTKVNRWKKEKKADYQDFCISSGTRKKI